MTTSLTVRPTYGVGLNLGTATKRQGSHAGPGLANDLKPAKIGGSEFEDQIVRNMRTWQLRPILTDLILGVTCHMVTTIPGRLTCGDILRSALQFDLSWTLDAAKAMRYTSFTA
jgi:hypothetical protein